MEVMDTSFFKSFGWLNSTRESNIGLQTNGVVVSKRMIFTKWCCPKLVTLSS